MSYVRQYKSNVLLDEFAFPFRLKVNFKKLMQWWKEQAEVPGSSEAPRAAEVLNAVEKIPELHQSFDNTEWIEKYQEEIRLLLSPIFPSLTTTNEIKAAAMPFKPVLFNLTKRFANILDGSQGDIHVSVSNPEMMVMAACIAILNRHYNANISFTPNIYFDIGDEKSGIVRRYRAFINSDFADIVPVGALPAISEKDIHELTNNFGDIELWKNKIPPGNFGFEGVTILTLFDVTREESVSALKFNLLKKDALILREVREQIEKNLGALLNVPNLKTGFISYDSDRKLLRPIGLSLATSTSILMPEKKKEKIDKVFCDRSTQSSFNRNQAFVLQDVNANMPEDPELAKKLLKLGLNGYVAVPLFYNDELIGILELGADQPNALNTITVYKLQEVILLFTTALKRSRDEMKSQVETIIRQQCTAIHPSVAWRFTEAAENLLESKSFNSGDTMEDIIFPDVYPLYGQTDIQGSSTERNRSIQTDLIEQLSLAKNVLDLSVEKFAFPVYKDLRFRIGNYIQQLEQELSAGDENVVLEFLKEEIYPVFDHLHTLRPEIDEALLNYEKQLDPSLGLLYKRRKDYDHSVKLINENISGYLDKAQEAAQAMFPHYFEKYKTDGVEHNLYIGQSLVNNQEFHPLHLQNLRLWQLLVTCEIENVIHRIMPQLKAKLSISSLILVHSNPLSIRFRMEEKKFDVDGAYNVRYEIIKKRIDKAYVKEANERLVQPGKLAIIYSQEKEAKEYVNYLHYLQSINYIGPDIEWLTLTDLQGITGLKALRVEVVHNKSFTGIKESKAVEVLEEINQS
jgi:hypothetical protein